MCRESLENKPTCQETPSSKQVHAIFCIMLKLMGGKVSVPLELVKKFPNIKPRFARDELNGVLYVSLPTKRKRGIIRPSHNVLKPQKRIIVPN